MTSKASEMNVEHPTEPEHQHCTLAASHQVKPSKSDRSALVHE